MQQTDKHIAQLLYEHNCVIVPGFGGFLANYSSAKIHPAHHLFSPPSKHIVFNKNLKNNDGLLANQIASAENVNYSEAINQISKFVDTTNALLKKGEKVNIDSVGTLYLDVERKVQFKPSTTNFLTEAFGLSEFQSPAIKPDNLGKRVEKELKKEGAKMIPFKVAEKGKRKINVKRILAVAATVMLIFGIFWISLKTDVVKQFNYSNINPFVTKGIVKDTIVIHTKKIIAPETLIKTVADTFSTTIVSNPVTPSLMEESNVNKQVSQVVEPKKNGLPVTDQFHLVAGCFQIKENAIKFVNQLKNQGVEAEIIGKNEHDLFVVSCGNYHSKTEAEKNLKRLRKSQPDAWLYKSV